jgi:hypothetical protein
MEFCPLLDEEQVKFPADGEDQKKNKQAGSMRMLHLLVHALIIGGTGDQ